ncbi:hypothetical protein KW419_21075 [Vibrio fluvialis]|nr:hypothetical protein [Vibrio fluvialis]
MKARFLLIVVLLTLLSGCASTPTFYSYVDSISAPEAKDKKTYVLFPGNKDTSPDDLQYIEYKNYIINALNYNGFIIANDFENADVAIFLGYGIGDPQTEQYSYSVPTWGQTGVSSATTYGTLNTFGSTSTYSGTTTYTPTYGITGSTTHIGTRTTFFRFLKLTAYDVDEYKRTEKLKQVWQTTVTSSGSSGDLRQVLPILAAASSPYLGTNTGKKLAVDLKENDPSVIKIKGITK